MISYDKGKTSTYIIILDTNNLYGLAIIQCFPTGGFKWLTQNGINSLDIKTIWEDNQKGCILEVDLAYPEELHYLYNDYPLTSEKVEIKESMIFLIWNVLSMKNCKWEKARTKLGNKYIFFTIKTFNYI